MAGKSRKQGSRPSTPKAVPMELPKGHLGIKSSPYAPTDCKLTSQYMVVDHMSAHYRKLTKAKCAIDNKPPKAWMVSQKVRDQARRHALTAEAKRRDKWENKEMVRTGRSMSRASSDIDRDEMLAMMEDLEEYDEIDGVVKPRVQADVNTTMEVHISDGYPDDRDMALVNQMVTDNRNSPSKYHGTRVISSNIPRQNARPGSGRHNSERPNSGRNRQNGYIQNGYMNTTHTVKQPSTPKSADLLDTQSYKFTEEKPFQPRLNRTTAQSKLSTFKYYNAPKRTPRDEPKVSRNQTRPVTPLTDSVDLMNASLMSRDLGTMRTPTGVPPLDISLDADHLTWLKEQSKKAHLRSTYVAKENEINESKKQQTSGGFGQHTVTNRLEAGEEELKYLEFIQEVTNDVLDRGIFTNRVLKQVFNAHLQRRKHDLKVSRMRELLEELRQNLGIPAADDDVDSGVGLTSTLTQPRDKSQSPTRSLKFADSSSTKYIDDNMNTLSLDDGRGGTLGGFDPMMMTTKKFDMSALRSATRAASQSRSRSPSPGTGRPPLPKARKGKGGLSHENSYEDDDGIMVKSYTSLDDLDDSRIISKEDEDLHAYKEPPPCTSSILGPGRNIETIEELRETARTDATSVAEYQDDYEDDDDTHRDNGKNPIPKPTPRKRHATTSKGSPSTTARTVTDTARSVFDSEYDTYRSGDGSARSREGSARSGGRSGRATPRSRSGSPASKTGTPRSRSATPTGQPRSRSITPKSGRNTPNKLSTKKGSTEDDDF